MAGYYPEMPRGKQRRSLDGSRGGRVASGGDPSLAAVLRAAIEAPAADRDIGRSLTHGFHSYPARMHPAIARELIAGLEPASLLDPFCGSGTTLVEAIRVGVPSVGVDASPLAIRLATTKTWPASGAERRSLRRAAREIADEAIEVGKEARRAGAPPRRKGRPELTRWFAGHVYAELETLLLLIRERGEHVEHLEMALSSILHKLSLRSSDTDRSQVQKQIGRGAPSRQLRARVDELVEGLAELAAFRGPAPEIRSGDARELDLAPHSIDAVITSPPYPGTYNYAGHHDLRIAFLGLDDAGLERAEVGARRHFRRDSGKGLERWRGDMLRVLSGLRAALRPGGWIAMLAGDSLAGERAVRADQQLGELAETAGLERIAWAWQGRKTLGGREKRAFVKPGKREHLILFR